MGRLPRRRTTIAVLLLSLVATACGGDPGPAADASDGAAGAGATEDAAAATADGTEPAGCTIATTAEVEEATGFTVLGAEELYGGCRWSIEGVDEDVLEPAISWQPFDGGQVDSQRQAGEAGMDVTDLPGIGDEAFSLASGAGDHPLGEVWVRVGDVSFRVTNEFSTGRYAGSLDHQAGLAALVADRLG